MALHNLFLTRFSCSALCAAILLFGNPTLANDLAAAQKAVRLQQYEEAFSLYKEAAEGGDTDAQYQLASMYLQGRGTPKSESKAKEWFEAAAKQSHPGAQYNLALLINKDEPERARTLLEESAKQGFRSAKVQLEQVPKVKPVKQEVPVETQWFGAARRNDLALLKSLLDSNEILNITDHADRTALFYTVEAGHQDATEWLIEKGSDVNHMDKFGSTPLHLSIDLKEPTVTQMLLKAGADKTKVLPNGDNFIHRALRRKQYAHAQVLIDSGVNVNHQNKDGWTPLDLAEYQKAEPAIAQLLKRGATHGSGWGSKRKPQDLQAITEQLQESALPPLARAIMNDNPKLVERLLSEEPELVNTPLEDGTTPLILAVKHGKSEMISELLAQGALVNQVAYRGVNAVQVASQQGNAKVLKLLLAAGGSPTRADEQNRDAVMDAIEKENGEITALLLDNIFDPAHQENTAKAQVDQYILLATQHHAEDALERLLPRATSKPAKDKQDRNALWFAASEGNSNLITKLLKAKIPADQPDKDGRTPFLMAVTKGCLACAKQLLAFNKIDYPSKAGNTALMIAALNGDAPMVGWLLQNKTDVELRNQRGDTALMLAVGGNKIEVVKLLLNANASATRKNKLGFSAIDLAKDVSPQMLELVKSKAVLGIF